MLIVACKLLSIPIVLGSLLSIWIALQSALRAHRGSAAPRGLERLLGGAIVSAEGKGRERWQDGEPRHARINHLDTARIINAPLTVCLCLGFAWPQVDSPGSFMAAILLTLLAYLLVSGLGSLLAFLLMLRLGFARASDEDGGGGERSLYHPENYPPGGDGILPEPVWVSRHTSRIDS